MALFDPRKQTGSERNRKLYAAYEIGYTIVDFAAGMMFLVGSVMFLYPSLVAAGSWLFVIGSACFALKPTIRVVRELHYAAISDWDDVEEVARS
jgi:hypothetical protein